MLTKKSRNALIKGILTKKSPIYVQYAVSKLCNLKCKMCASTSTRKDEKELNLEQIKRLANVLDKLGVGVIVITGGEPFLRKDLPQIIKIFSKKGFDTKLQTNGITDNEQKIKQVVEAGLNEVTISLDTLNEEKQDNINSVKGSWKKTINSISLFSKYLPKKGCMPIINTVVSRVNISDVPNVIKFTTKIGFYNSIIPVHISDDEDFIIRKKSEEFKFSKEDNNLIDQTYNKLIEMKKQSYHVHNSIKFLKASAEFLKYGKVNWRCDSPDLYFSISPEGKFLPCVDLKGEKSMLDDDFINVFKSRNFRNKIRYQIKTCLGCMYACYPEISHLCRKPSVLLERTLQGIKINKYKRNPVSFEDSLKIIEDIKNENKFSKTKL